MPTYSGYVSPDRERPNWAKLSGELSTSIKDAIGARGRQRDKNDQVFADNQETINEYELGQNQDFNTLILDGANDIRDKMSAWNEAVNNRTMSPSEYKKKMQTAMSYWTQFSKTASSFDERTKATLERQQTGAGSGFENYINMQNAKEADLGGSKIYMNPDSGAIYLTKQDENGNILSETDVRQANNPGNMVDNRFDLNTAVKDNVTTWGEWTTAIANRDGSGGTVADKRNAVAYSSAKNSLIDSILSDNRSATSILVDNSNGAYKFYKNEAELEEKMAAATEKARRDYEDAGVEFNESEFVKTQMDQMIRVDKDATGVYQPSLTEAQMTAAREVVSTEIEIQTGHKETAKARRAPTASNKNKNENKGSGSYATVATLDRAWKDADNKKMTAIALDGYEIKINNKNGYGADVYEVGFNSDGTKFEDLVTRVTDRRDLAPYIWKTGTGKDSPMPLDKFDAEWAAYRGRDEGLSADELYEKYK